MKFSIECYRRKGSVLLRPSPDDIIVALGNGKKLASQRFSMRDPSGKTRPDRHQKWDARFLLLACRLACCRCGRSDARLMDGLVSACFLSFALPLSSGLLLIEREKY